MANQMHRIRGDVVHVIAAQWFDDNSGPGSVPVPVDLDRYVLIELVWDHVNGERFWIPAIIDDPASGSFRFEPAAPFDVVGTHRIQIRAEAGDGDVRCFPGDGPIDYIIVTDRQTDQVEHTQQEKRDDPEKSIT